MAGIHRMTQPIAGLSRIGSTGDRGECVVAFRLRDARPTALDRTSGTAADPAGWDLRRIIKGWSRASRKDT